MRLSDGQVGDVRLVHMYMYVILGLGCIDDNGHPAMTKMSEDPKSGFY
jgi:hypothetical protein